MKKTYHSPVITSILLDMQEGILIGSGTQSVGTTDDEFIENETSVLSTGSNGWSNSSWTPLFDEEEE